MQLQRPVGSGCLLKNWRFRKLIFLRSVASRVQKKSPYAVLGVDPKADIKEIKERFYKLSKEHHPDISKDASSMEKFREIAEAYETLSNPELRSKYDQVLAGGRHVSFKLRSSKGEWADTTKVSPVSASRSKV